MTHHGDDMDLLDIDDTHRLRREDAAPPACPRRRTSPTQLGRVHRGGQRITVGVPDEVNLKIEVEIGDENELEIELTW